MSRVLRGLAAALLCAMPGLASAANIVVNGTFDDTTSGWTGSWNLRSESPTIDTGTYYFADPLEYDSISQSYVLTGADLLTLADTGLSYTLSADFFGWYTQGDYSTLTLSFFDGLGTLLGADVLAGSVGGWAETVVAGSAESLRSMTGALPATTASLFLKLESYRIEGYNNDGYVDNVSLMLSPSVVGPGPDPAPVPLPASGVLLLAGAGALAALRRRRG